MNDNEEQLLADIEAEEKRQKAEDSKKQLKAILLTFFPLLIGFLVFTYFFLNSIEEKAREQRKDEARQARQLQKQNSTLNN